MTTRLKLDCYRQITQETEPWCLCITNTACLITFQENTYTYQGGEGDQDNSSPQTLDQQTSAQPVRIHIQHSPTCLIIQYMFRMEYVLPFPCVPPYEQFLCYSPSTPPPQTLSVNEQTSLKSPQHYYLLNNISCYIMYCSLIIHSGWFHNKS